jgi:hypothetical protein
MRARLAKQVAQPEEWDSDVFNLKMKQYRTLVRNEALEALVCFTRRSLNYRHTICTPGLLTSGSAANTNWCYPRGSAARFSFVHIGLVRLQFCAESPFKGTKNRV